MFAMADVLTRFILWVQDHWYCKNKTSFLKTCWNNFFSRLIDQDTLTLNGGQCGRYPVVPLLSQMSGIGTSMTIAFHQAGKWALGELFVPGLSCLVLTLAGSKLAQMTNTEALYYSAKITFGRAKDRIPSSVPPSSQPCSPARKTFKYVLGVSGWAL